MKRGFSLILLMLAATLARGVMVIDSYRFAAAQPAAYFGNVDSSGNHLAYPSAPSFDWYGAYTFGNNRLLNSFVCPGTGQRTLDLLGVFMDNRGGGSSGNVRMAIYTYEIYTQTLVKICEWSSSQNVTAALGTGAWYDSGTFTGSTALTGGVEYVVAFSTDGGLPRFGYTTSGGQNMAVNTGSDYTAGFPDPISLAGTAAYKLALRARVAAGGGGPPYAPTQETYYVDPSFGGTSYGSSSNPYKSLNAAIAARCNKTFTMPIQIICRTSGSTVDTTRVDTGGLGQMVPSSTNYLLISADAGHEAGTSWDSSKYSLVVPYASSTGTAMNLPTSYVRIENLQIGISGTQSGTAEIVYWSGTDLRMSGSIIKGLNSSTQVTRCMSISTNTSTCKLWNNIFYGIGANTGGATTNLQNHGNTDVYSCTFVGYGSINVNNASDGVMRMTNTYCGGAITAAISDQSSGNLTQSYNISSDSTASGTGSQTTKAVNTTQFTNVTTGSENFAIPGSGSALYHSGTDTSGGTAPLNFTTAIGGATRSSPWDVGAAKY